MNFLIVSLSLFIFPLFIANTYAQPPTVSNTPTSLSFKMSNEGVLHFLDRIEAKRTEKISAKSIAQMYFGYLKKADLALDIELITHLITLTEFKIENPDYQPTAPEFNQQKQKEILRRLETRKIKTKDTFQLIKSRLKAKKPDALLLSQYLKEFIFALETVKLLHGKILVFGNRDHITYQPRGELSVSDFFATPSIDFTHLSATSGSTDSLEIYAKNRTKNGTVSLVTIIPTLNEDRSQIDIKVNWRHRSLRTETITLTKDFLDGLSEGEEPLLNKASYSVGGFLETPKQVSTQFVWVETKEEGGPQSIHKIFEGTKPAKLKANLVAKLTKSSEKSTRAAKLAYKKSSPKLFPCLKKVRQNSQRG